MKVLLVVNNLSGGGAEKVAVDLANLFCKNNITSILTLSDKEDKFSVDSSVSRLKLNLKSNSRTVLSGIKANITRITKLRATILKEEPDVVITFMNRTNIRVLISLLFTKIPIIITEHNYPKTNPMSRSWELLRRVLYKRAYKLVSVSSGISDYFSFLPEKKKEVIYNPTELHFLEDKSLLDLSKKNIIAMGRLVPLKGFDLLIKAFSLIAEDYPNWNLSFIGDGPERNSLIKLIESYGLEKRIYLLGYSKTPHSVIKSADIFVLSSKHEGLGNVIIEAMKCGIPVVSTNCPVGPKELIIDGVTGILVDNESIPALKNGLIKLISDENLRKKLVENAFNNLNKFSNEVIFSQWEEILKGIRGHND